MIRNRRLIRWAVTFFAAVGMLLAQGAGTAGTGPGANMANRLDRVATLLSLTPDQKTQVATIVQNSMQQAKPLMAQMRTNRQAIENLVKSGTTENFDQQIQSLANTQASLTSQLTVIRAKALAQVWNLLTPDQRTKASQLHELMGMGAGPMMGGMRPQRAHQGPPQGQ